MKLKELALLLNDAVTKGAAIALTRSGAVPARLTKAEAFRLYGRSTIERWCREGLISLISDHGKVSKKCIDSIQLHAVAAACNRNTYLPVAER